MDPNSHQASGLGLPQPPAADDAQSQDSAVPVAQPVAPSAVGAPDEANEALDQEWVDKAKDIVEQTKSDPFTQTRELSKVKAAYLKTRYNKDLKTHEDGA